MAGAAGDCLGVGAWGSALLIASVLSVIWEENEKAGGTVRQCPAKGQNEETRTRGQVLWVLGLNESVCMWQEATGAGSSPHGGVAMEQILGIQCFEVELFRVVT